MKLPAKAAWLIAGDLWFRVDLLFHEELKQHGEKRTVPALQQPSQENAMGW